MALVFGLGLLVHNSVELSWWSGVVLLYVGEAVSGGMIDLGMDGAECVGVCLLVDEWLAHGEGIYITKKSLWRHLRQLVSHSA